MIFGSSESLTSLLTGPPRPIAEFRLDEASGAVAINRTNRNADGTYVSVDVGAIDGIYGDNLAPTFDGVDDQVNANNVALTVNSLGSELIMMAWVKLAVVQPAGDEYLLYIKSTTSNNFVRILNLGGSDLMFANAKIASVSQTSLTVTNNRLGWVHLAFILSKSNNLMKLRSEGVDSVIDSSFDLFDEDFTAFIMGSVGGANFHEGSLSYIEIRSTSGLSVAAIDALADRHADRTQGYKTTFVAMDVRRPADHFDLAHLTFEGVTRTTSPFASGGAHFNNTTNNNGLYAFRALPTDLIPSAGNTIYISAWAQFDADGGLNTIVSTGKNVGAANERNYHFFRNSNDKVRFFVYDSIGNLVFVESDVVAKDVLVHMGCCLDFDARSFKLSINGGTYFTGALVNDPATFTGELLIGKLAQFDVHYLFGTLGPVVVINQPKADADPLPGLYNSGTPLTTLDEIEAEIVDPDTLKACYLWPKTTSL